MNQGIYEELVTQLVSEKIKRLDKDAFYREKYICSMGENYINLHCNLLAILIVY